MDASTAVRLSILSAWLMGAGMMGLSGAGMSASAAGMSASPAEMAGPPAPALFKDFDDTQPYPDEVALRALIEPVPGQRCQLGAAEIESRPGQRRITEIEGLFRLKAQWRDDSALRISVFPASKYRLHFWSGREGVENGLQSHELYGEIRAMREHLDELIESAMPEVVELLERLEQEQAGREQTFMAARRKSREIVVRLLIERQRLLRRLRIAEMAAQVRELIRQQSGVLAADDIRQTIAREEQLREATRRAELTPDRLEQLVNQQTTVRREIGRRAGGLSEPAQPAQPRALGAYDDGIAAVAAVAPRHVPRSQRRP